MSLSTAPPVEVATPIFPGSMGIFFFLWLSKNPFFDSFGFEGFKEFLLQDDRKTLNKKL